MHRSTKRLGSLAAAALFLSSCVSNGPAGEEPRMADPSTLAGTQWRLVSLPGVGEVDPADTVTLDFVEDARVAGRTGCNQFSGPIAADQGGVRLGPLILTKMACVDPDAQEVENAYVAALESTRSFHIQDEQLVLADENGAELARLARR